MKSLGSVLLSLAVATGCATADDFVNPRDMKFGPVEFNPPQSVRFELPNGLTVYFLEDHQSPVVTATAFFRGGTAGDPADAIGLTGLMATLMRSGGAGHRSSEAIDEQLDFYGASVSADASSEQTQVGMRCLRRDLDSVLAVFVDVILNPRFDSSQTALELSNMQDEIRRQNDDPNDVARRLFYENVYPHHPYGRFATLESAGRISRAALAARHGLLCRPNNCWLAVSGDMTEPEVRAVVERAFGSWARSETPLPTVTDAQVDLQPGVYYASKDINQANIRLGHLCLSDRHPDRHIMQIVQFALGDGFTSRITREVRTTAGLAYTAGSWFSQRRYGGSFFGYCLTEAGNMSAAVKMIREIVDGVRREGITQEEMDLAKESIINSFVFNATTPQQIVETQASLEVDGFPPDQLQRSLAAYRAVTLEDCKRVAAANLHPDRMVIVVVGNKDLFDAPLSELGPVTEVPLDIR